MIEYSSTLAFSAAAAAAMRAEGTRLLLTRKEGQVQERGGYEVRGQ